MSEDFQKEDEAEKLAQNPSEVVIQYLSEHGIISKEKLVSLLIEKCDLSKDKAERIFDDYLRKGKISYSRDRGGYLWSNSYKGIRITKPPALKFPPHRKARGRIESVIRLPPDPHMLPVKSYFLGKDNPSQAYYHPAMDQDKLAYLRAKEKMGAGADWPA